MKLLCPRQLPAHGLPNSGVVVLSCPFITTCLFVSRADGFRQRTKPYLRNFPTHSLHTLWMQLHSLFSGYLSIGLLVYLLVGSLRSGILCPNTWSYLPCCCCCFGYICESFICRNSSQKRPHLHICVYIRTVSGREFQVRSRNLFCTFSPGRPKWITKKEKKKSSAVLFYLRGTEDF